MSAPESIDRASRIPLYLQLAEVLRIHVEGLLDGELLPSIGRLTERYGVGRGVVRAALQELEREGLVVVEAGIGAFRRPRPSINEVDARAGDVVATRPPTPAERRFYDLSPAVSMLVITRAGTSVEEAYPGDRTVVRMV
ncbi:winged helix-turn-helix domain-containing protein [Actinocorallia sp. A-T 12471]|uniref:winged helix-turn-helix domain-containing protein n=1 Tax=Actinocorallia sp. A-T 12471 TaxID=3089813 RepID=UPI0029CCFCC0|nr:winged helix-turn-helix domain-containing protein [Actinocorallia sp. A-T 12471]MDX6742693.1 winged helix-turn-helix domain-containing protein [Actinocorallia sp. A-T 12471]